MAKVFLAVFLKHNIVRRRVAPPIVQNGEILMQFQMSIISFQKGKIIFMIS